MRIAVFLHLYYPNSWAWVKPKVQALPADTFFLVNIGNENFPAEDISDIRTTLPGIIIRTPNKGKDIGGKLALLDMYLKLGITSTFMVFLHDKTSPHLPSGKHWMEKLFSIIEVQNLPKIEALFATPTIGMVGIDEHRITLQADNLLVYANNKPLLDTMLQRYNLQLSDNAAFIGGTMFWVRSSIYEQFFRQHAPLQVRRQLEAGNVMDHDAGTYTHSWERLLGWIVGHYGFKIAGI